MVCLDDQAVHAWLRGDVADAQRDVVREHLDVCDSCRDLVAITIDARWIGSVVGRYRIVALIGGGAMGEFCLLLLGAAGVLSRLLRASEWRPATR